MEVIRTMNLPPRGSAALPGRRIFATLLAAVLAAACDPAAPEADEGAFVVRLGSDTVGVESYSLDEQRMEILAVSRSPRTLLRQAVVEFDGEGGIARYESRVRDPAAPGDAPPLQQVVILYEADSATVETGVGEAMERRRIAADPTMVPLSFDHFSLEELAIRQALAADRETVSMLSDGPVPVALRRPAPDSVILDTPQLGSWLARVDGDGRILGMSAGALGRDVERVPDLDVEALARRYAEADARGEGMGPLSPRDTLRATVHGARISVDYSRPSVRGRQVFGGIVPYGEVWRLGADLATHLETDRALVVAGERIPAGAYTLFTVPEPDGWTLMVNEETGQPGTSHDPERDVVRAPMETAPLDAPVERLSILLEEEGEEGVLLIRWDRTEARVPFQVDPGRGS
jgi:hypothetical protein